MTNPLQSYLETVEQRRNETTPGKWFAHNGSILNNPKTIYDSTRIADNLSADDSKFIEYARQDIPTLLAICRGFAEALEFYAGWWGPHQGSPIKGVNQFTQNRLNESGEKARQALARAGEMCTKEIK